ncbi:esterase-like activity of phytase family protein [Erythrobacter gaetbuli]|uniref:Esterase-like activity of phytase family protein n=1 Tax=Qipengyuania gaetbuli TaxID=266952 RepID=A0A844Y1Z6_9SPHN|nr:esterase-like activity of phytase family protein [Qipengyuania gaetbuli]MXO51856.1 esterase-like activity of phytase family protein [Qipengyuania gaetbuli]
MRPRRLVLAILVALSLAPSTFMRSPPPPVGSPYARFAPIEFAPATIGPLELAGAWEIVGRHRDFGGFSAMVILPDGQMRLGSDAGRLFTIGRPDRAGEIGGLTVLAQRRGDGKVDLDLEALTRDPDTGDVWGAYESSNRIVRFDQAMQIEATRKPPEMRDWGVNSGPEAFARLPNGRFIAIEERSQRWGSTNHRGVLFSGDPVRDVSSEPFTLDAPEGYRPVDATALDEGRVLVLLRSLEFGFPPRFGTAIGMIDIAALGSGKPVTVQMVAALVSPVPADNFEAIAVTREGGDLAVWLVSDDNFMSYQRTLVLKFVWQARQKARR